MDEHALHLCCTVQSSLDFLDWIDAFAPGRFPAAARMTLARYASRHCPCEADLRQAAPGAPIVLRLNRVEYTLRPRGGATRRVLS